MNATPLRRLLSAALLLFTAGHAHAGCYTSRLTVGVEVKIRGATLKEAMDSIKAAALNQSGFEGLPLNIVVGAEPDPARRLSLAVKDVPLQRVLEEMARAFGLRMRIEPYAVVLSSFTALEPIHTRTYRVPPDFIGTGSAAK